MVIGDSGGRLASVGQIDDPDEVASLLGQAQYRRSERATSVTFTSLMGKLGQKVSKRRRPEADWDELDTSSSSVADSRSERDELLSGLHDGNGHEESAVVTRDFQRRTPVEPIEDNDLPSRSDDDAEAQAAVEAARYDIQALRAKLREVTGRLTEPPTQNNDESEKTFPPNKIRDDEAGAA
jgi:hypothetical protein